MKIIFVHGDHTEKSRERLKKFIDVARKRGWRIERLDDSNGQTLPELLTLPSLFDEERLYLLEKVTLTKKTDLVWLKENYKNLTGNLVIYHTGYLPKRTLVNLPKPDKEEVFKLPGKIWSFLYSFYPGNFKRAVTLLHEVLENEKPEFILACLSRHLKDIYLVKKDSSLLDYPSWRIKRLESQASKFEEKEIISIIKDLAEADFKSKTGRDDLVFLLDVILARKLE